MIRAGKLNGLNFECDSLQDNDIGKYFSKDYVYNTEKLSDIIFYVNYDNDYNFISQIYNYVILYIYKLFNI